MKKLIICVFALISINAFSQETDTNFIASFKRLNKNNFEIKSPTVKIKNYDIPLYDMPINEAYKIPINSQINNYYLSRIMVFASNNKKYIAFGISNNSDENPGSTIEMYDNKGNLKWKYKLDKYYPMESKISNNGNSYFLLTENLDEQFNTEIIVFNKEGEKVFFDDKIDRINADYNNEIIYYMKDRYQTNNIDDEKTLYCYNSKTNKTWSKKFESSRPLALLSASENGDNVICGTDTLYCINNNGKVKWQQNIVYEFLEENYLSYNGEYDVRTCVSEYWELFDSKGNTIFRKGTTKIDEYNIKPACGFFVVNDKDNIIVINSSVGYHKILIAFYNIKGVLLDYIIVNDACCYIEVEAISDKIYKIYSNKKFILDYQKKW